jgi:hypothetical protein
MILGLAQASDWYEVLFDCGLTKYLQWFELEIVLIAYQKIIKVFDYCNEQ